MCALDGIVSADAGNGSVADASGYVNGDGSVDAAAAVDGSIYAAGVGDGSVAAAATGYRSAVGCTVVSG